jgi:hypothetical protein
MKISLTLDLLARREGGESCADGIDARWSIVGTRYLCWCRCYARKVDNRCLYWCRSCWTGLGSSRRGSGSRSEVKNNVRLCSGRIGLPSTPERHKFQRRKRWKAVGVIGGRRSAASRCTRFTTTIARLWTPLCGISIRVCLVHRPDAEHGANHTTSNHEDDNKDDREPASGPEPRFLWFIWVDREYVMLVRG